MTYFLFVHVTDSAYHLHCKNCRSYDDRDTQMGLVRKMLQLVDKTAMSHTMSQNYLISEKTDIIVFIIQGNFNKHNFGSL